MRFLFQFTFHAFMLWSFIWAFSRQATQFGYPVDKIDRVVSFAAVAMGVTDVILLLLNFLDDDMRASMMIMAFQEHWMTFWVFPFTYLILMQLLWINRFRRSKVFRIALALWLFVFVNMETLVILITSFHRDHVPATW